MMKIAGASLLILVYFHFIVFGLLLLSDPNNCTEANNYKSKKFKQFQKKEIKFSCRRREEENTAGHNKMFHVMCWLAMFHKLPFMITLTQDL